MNRTYRLLFLLGFFSFVSSQTTMVNPAKTDSTIVENRVLTPEEKLEEALERMKEDPMVRKAKWGFVLYNPKTKKILSSYNENQPLIPASTTKLLTTNIAMEVLGAKFQFQTRLEYTGHINEEGVLDGDLYLEGSGDPTLGTGLGGSYNYQSIIAGYLDALRGKGITEVKGNIYAQTVFFKKKEIDFPPNIVWLAQKDFYLPVGGTQGIDPQKEKVEKQEQVKEGRYYYISPYTNRLVYTDTFTERNFIGKLPAAPILLAKKLKTSMNASGIKVQGSVEVKTYEENPQPRTFVSVYLSPYLEDTIYFVNQHSHNLFAELLLKTVGFYKNGDETKETGAHSVVDFLHNKGYDFDQLRMVDGSGLSRQNQVTPLSQAKFLAELMKKPYYQTYQNSLPLAGQTGTLKKMFLASEANGNISAKTGTLNGVKCLAGYIHTKKGETYTFSLLINNYIGTVAKMKMKMEALLNPIIDL